MIVFIRRGNKDIQEENAPKAETYGEGRYVKTEAEIGIMLPQAKEQLELLKDGSCKEGSIP